MDQFKIVLAIDSGSFKTDIAAVKYRGDEPEKIARCQGGPLNVALLEPHQWQSILSNCFDKATAEYGEAVRFDVVLLAIAGANREVVRDEISEWTQNQLGVQDVIVMSSDDLVLAIGEAMVAENESIIAVNAGAGSIALGVEYDSESVIQSGGVGPRFGDEGSGYWIGNQAIRAVLAAAQGWKKETNLSELVFGHVDSNSADGLVAHFNGNQNPQSAIAALTPLVIEAMKSGDDVATGIIQQAGSKLNELAKNVYQQMDSQDYVLVASGQLLCQVAEINEAFKKPFADWDTNPTDIYYIEDPVMPAVAFAARIE